MLWQKLLPEIRDYVNGSKFKETLRIPDQAAVEVQFLAQGEYNLNYLLRIETGLPGGAKAIVFRVNTSSQLNLSNQIRYEYQALELLKKSGVTPQPLYLDDTLKEINYGLLAMEYLPGEPLNYARDLILAAQTFARIHSLPVTPEETDFLIKVEGPFSVIAQEAESLLKPYFDCPAADRRVKSLLEKLFILSQIKIQEEKYFAREPWRAVINTEVNSHNFIVQRERRTCHLIDWEKPIYGEPAQDLSMFLIPTTTLWKQDTILTPEQEELFIQTYLEALPLTPEGSTLRDRIESFKFFNLLRAISWCAMAWTEYTQPGRAIVNPDTFAKIKLFIDPDFIQKCFPQVA